MQVTVTSEHRFHRTPDGAVWTETAHPYRFWTRYAPTFSAVKVVARVLPLPEPAPGAVRADGDGVKFVGIPYYVGPVEYVKRRTGILKAVRESVSVNEAVILRVASQLACCLEPELKRRRQPYGVEVITDPWDIFSPKANPHPLRPLLRLWSYAQLRRQCKRAAAAAYVTEHALQSRYPCSTYSVGVSDVELKSSDFVEELRTWPDAEGRGFQRPFVIITTATMAAMYKGNDVLIRAAALCKGKGVDIRLRLIGDGRFRSTLEDLARFLSIAEHTEFIGQLPSGPAILRELDKADLFVLPSRQEGLPRAMVEAMARGLPCIGSDVGGIPELLLSEDIVPRNNPEALAEKMVEVLKSKDRLERMSMRNLRRARDFDKDMLGGRRQEFLERLKESTSHWVRHSSAKSR